MAIRTLNLPQSPFQDGLNESELNVDSVVARLCMNRINLDSSVSVNATLFQERILYINEANTIMLYFCRRFR